MTIYCRRTEEKRRMGVRNRMQQQRWHGIDEGGENVLISYLIVGKSGRVTVEFVLF